MWVGPEGGILDLHMHVGMATRDGVWVVDVPQDGCRRHGYLPVVQGMCGPSVGKSKGIQQYPELPCSLAAPDAYSHPSRTYRLCPAAGRTAHALYHGAGVYSVSQFARPAPVFAHQGLSTVGDSFRVRRCAIQRLSTSCLPPVCFASYFTNAPPIFETVSPPRDSGTCQSSMSFV